MSVAKKGKVLEQKKCCSLSWEPLREFTGVVLLLKNRFLRQIETAGWPIFDQVGRPSRLVLGKKFFWIWFIYALEGIVLAWQFFLTTFPIWNTLVYTFCVSYFKDTCGDLHWTATSTSVSSISFLEPCVQTLQGVKGILDIELRYWYRVLHRKFYQIVYWVGGHFGLGKTLFEANMSRD